MQERINVLDKGFVELQDMMGDDLAIVNAARVSFLGESKGDEADKKLLRYLMSNRHTSPFEQVIFKFRIKAPLLVWWQMVRHRTASINMQSGRYTEFEADEFYEPSAWRLQSTDNKQASEGEADEFTAADLDDSLAEHIAYSISLYKDALRDGVAREQARLFLPAFAVYYTGVWTMDAHNLMHFLNLRMHPHAQWEIRQYANAIYDIFAKKLPWTAEAFIKQRNIYARARAIAEMGAEDASTKRLIDWGLRI